MSVLRSTSERTLIQAAAVVGVATTLGLLIADAPQVAVLFLAAILGAAATAAPSSAWVAGALVAAISFKGLASVGALPGTAAFLDIPLAWTALAVALVRQRKVEGNARTLVLALGLLAATIGWSALLNGTELARPLFYLLLLGEPLAIVCTFAIDRPTSTQIRQLERVIIILLAAQVPIAYAQAVEFGIGDKVQGTLWGAGAGHHVIGAVAAVGVVWLIYSRPIGSRPSVILAALLAPIPFLTDAKQVVLALPAAFILVRWTSFRDLMFRVGAVSLAVIVLVVAFPAGKVALSLLGDARGGKSGKEVTLVGVWSNLRGDPAALAFGLGPAMTVSRAAFMTTDAYLGEDSPLRVVGLSPSRFAETAQATTVQQFGRRESSFNSALSSAIGALGDIGIIGIAAYLGFWAIVQLRLHRIGATDAATTVALMLVLGLVFDWWEQPPLTVLVATLAGLALLRVPRGGELAQSATTVTAGPPSARAGTTEERS